MGKCTIVLMLLLAMPGFAQEPLLPLEEYEQASATTAIENKVAEIEAAVPHPDISPDAMRKLGQHLAGLKESLLAVSEMPPDVLPNIVTPIANGTITSAYPTVGALLYGGNTVCTGTLIGPRNIVTARHCFADGRDPRAFQVFLQHAGIRFVSEIEFPDDEDVDLALICLQDPVPGIVPSSLPAALTAEGSARQIVGFGATSPTASNSGVKRHGSIVTSSCSPASADHICWLYDPVAKLIDPGSNVCGRDSGGPVGVALGADLQFKDGVTSNVLPVGACATTSKASSVAVVPQTAWLDSRIRACQGEADVDVLPCCGSGVEVLAQGHVLPTSGIHSKVWSFEVPEKTRLVTISLNAHDMGGTNLELEVLSPDTLPLEPGCIDLGRYVSCQYQYTSAPPPDWMVRVTNPGDTRLFHQIVVTLYPESDG